MQRSLLPWKDFDIALENEEKTEGGKVLEREGESDERGEMEEEIDEGKKEEISEKKERRWTMAKRRRFHTME